MSLRSSNNIGKKGKLQAKEIESAKHSQLRIVEICSGNQFEVMAVSPLSLFSHSFNSKSI